MNNMQDTEMENKPLILAGIRDNLLKPMTEEICSKTEKQIKSLRSQLTLVLGIAILSVTLNIIIITMMYFSR